MKRKKLLILVNSLSFFISHRLEIAIAAKKKGYKVVIVYGDKGKASTSRLSSNNIDFIQIPFERGSLNIFKEIKTFLNIAKIFYKLKPDIAHLITIKAYLYGGIVSRITKVPSLVTAVAGLGILFNQKKLKNIFFQILLYPLFKIAFNHRNQKIIFQNKGDIKILKNWIGIGAKKIELIHGSGVNLSEFKKIEETNNKIINICMASRLLHDKGVFDYISAARKIKEKGIKAIFYLAGDLDLQNSKSLSENDLYKIKIEKIVKYIGYQKDIAKLYAKSNIICLPSFYGEGLPKSLIEAAAASRAIVTTNVPGCRDAVISELSGLIIPPKNSKKLADAIEFLIKNPDIRISMGKAGRRLAEKKFSIQTVIKKHILIYDNL